MEPANVVPLDLDTKDPSEENLATLDEEIDSKIYTAIRELKETIYSFKRKLFYEMVSNDNKHKANELGAMYGYHAVFLQCIAYWIGMLDSTSVPKPNFASKKATDEFEALRKTIQTLAASSMDARILVYNLLFQFSTAHPFDLGAQKKDD